MTYRMMTEIDLPAVAALYMDYYNNHEDGEWTEITVTRRVRQVLTREDSYCMILESAGELIAFAMGYFEQFDDGMVYKLVEIVVAAQHQQKGIGSAFMRELEERVRHEGAIVMMLDAVNDDFHNRFYGNLGFDTATNLVIKTKTLI